MLPWYILSFGTQLHLSFHFSKLPISSKVSASAWLWAIPNSTLHRRYRMIPNPGFLCLFIRSGCPEPTKYCHPMATMQLILCLPSDPVADRSYWSSNHQLTAYACSLQSGPDVVVTVLTNINIDGYFWMRLGWFNFQYTWVINFVMRKRICSFVGFLSRGRLGVHVEPFEFFSVHVRGYGRLTEEGAGDEEDRPLVVRLLMKP